MLRHQDETVAEPVAEKAAEPVEATFYSSAFGRLRHHGNSPEKTILSVTVFSGNAKVQNFKYENSFFGYFIILPCV